MSESSPVPAGACDTHVHVVGPKDRYPLVAHRTYTPQDAPLAALRRMLSRLRVDRVVLVQPSVYGTDNRCLVDALEALGDTARGVAVLQDATPTSVLDDLHRRGVRGLRLNIATFGAAPLDTVRERLAATAVLCAHRGWHVQLFLPASSLPPLAPMLRQLPVPIVIDHFGLVSPGSLNDEPCRVLRELLGEGRVWVKLSAPYRIAGDPFDPQVARLAQHLADANPKQVVWGSDWPHTPPHGTTHTASDEEAPYRDLDTGALLAATGRWFSDPRQHRLMLVDNPARLYGFPE
jgi:predicted TIM-barrel fold metal-dependent hydrolase